MAGSTLALLTLKATEPDQGGAVHLRVQPAEGHAVLSDRQITPAALEALAEWARAHDQEQLAQRLETALAEHRHRMTAAQSELVTVLARVTAGRDALGAS